MVPASPKATNLCILRMMFSPPIKKIILWEGFVEDLSLSLSLSYTFCVPKQMVYFGLILQNLRQFRRVGGKNL